MRIAIIGAGVAGLCSARHALTAGYDVIVFEQTNVVGGTWVYTNQVGNDEYGLPIHSSMYQGLRTNLPKEIMCYPDYPIPCDTASYVTSACIVSYLEAFADDFHVREHIRFGHEVIRVRPVSETTQWEVIVRELTSNRHETMQFDAVMVGNGHSSDPKIPPFEGLDTYKGRYIHSKDFRVPDGYKDKQVLLVGMGPSGVDISMMTAKVANRVVVSYHNPNGAQKLPSHILVKPNIKRFNENSVEFVDGTTDTFDDIIFCTGYKYTFPFLSVDSEITVESDCYVKPLYKQCINIEHPTMILLGLVFRVCPFQVIDIQVRFFLSFLSGKRKLPTKTEMYAITAADMDKAYKLTGSIRFMHQLATLQAEYYNELSTIGGVDNIKPYVLKIYGAIMEYRKSDAVHYRRQTFRIIDDENFTSGFLDQLE